MIINEEVGLLKIICYFDRTDRAWYAFLAQQDGAYFGDWAMGYKKEEAIFNCGRRYQERNEYKLELA